MSKIYKLLDILKWSTEFLKKNGIEQARLDAEYLIASVLGKKRLDLYLNYEKPLSIKEREEIKKLLIKRGKNKIPLQYILGYEEFYGYKFEVNENVLIPRPETELLVEQCLEKIKEIKEPKILDIGTGSGAIAISIAKQRLDTKVLAVDIQEKALEVAKRNKTLNKAENIKFVKSDMFENVNYSEFDLIVSNPPYIKEEEYNQLMAEVKEHEPKSALLAEENGLYFYINITKNAKYYLKKGGILAFEIGYNQGKEVKEILQKNGYEKIRIIKDYSKNDRIIIGEKI
ncbi:MAG: protein-(glutamine-N5) methyltransferase, release factor-specific [Fusobacteriia bacterium 4572_132]|nr:MAG: protein-(glutamine-N5) methyltransferase, release factor-specific [Fusobacteriia bacterium 4572_132]